MEALQSLYKKPGEILGKLLHHPLLESRIRLGVTGLTRSGKTVFITSLVDQLHKRMCCLTEGPLAGRKC